MTRDEQLKAAKEKAQVALAKANAGEVPEATALLADAKTMAQTAQVMPEPTPETPAPVTMVRPLTSDVVTLTREQYQMIADRQWQLEMELQSAKVKELCDAALARGVPPAVVNVVSPILMACQRDAQATIKLTTEAQPVNLFNAVATILTTCPGHLGEVTLTTTGFKPADTPKKVMTVEEAEAEARKRRKELSIQTAVQTEVEL